MSYQYRDANGLVRYLGAGGAGTAIDPDVPHHNIEVGPAHDAVDTGSPVKIGGKAETTTPAAVADGDRVNAWFDEYGRLVTRADPGTAASSLGKAEDAAHASGDVGVMALSVRQDTAAALAGTNADYQPLITDASGRLHTAGADGGDVAHDAADAGNPVKIGGKASTSAPAAVAANDRVNAWMTLQGLVNVISPAASVDVNAAVAADVDAAVAAATGLRLVGFSCRESDGTPAVASFRIMHGATVAGGTAVYVVELAANESQMEWCWPGIDCASGISIDREAGTFDLNLFYVTVT